MGKIKVLLQKPFLIENIKDKQLVIKMLNYEEQLTKSDYGQSLYKNVLNMPLVSLTVEKAINRLTLSYFGFDTSDQSVEMYRTIFKTYFKSPDNYDKDVINAVHYMRENKCVFYKKPILKTGSVAPNCSLLNIDGITETTLYNVINKNAEYNIVAAFSLS